MMEIREGLPDNAGLGKRRMKNGQRQVVNLQTLVFAEVPGQRAGSAAAGTVVPTASAGCGIVMAGAGKEEDLRWQGHTETMPVPPTMTSRRVSSMMPLRNALTMVCRES